MLDNHFNIAPFNLILLIYVDVYAKNLDLYVISPIFKIKERC